MAKGDKGNGGGDSKKSQPAAGATRLSPGKYFLGAGSVEAFDAQGNKIDPQTLPVNGGYTYVRGDALTREGDELERMDSLLERAGIPANSRSRMLDRMVVERLQTLRRQRDDVRLWIGFLSVGSAAGGASDIS